jgi:1,4-alpha-glucan branching enzyme
MPIAEFGNSGSSWGYDPAQIFAADNSQYGGPDAFKTFVRACHTRGLAVLLDVVHNHYGPDDLDMWNFDGFAGTNSIGGGGIYFYQSDPALQITPYGDTRPNFSSAQVCNFIADNFSMWLGECHVDGFRWDTPDLMMHDNNGGYLPQTAALIQSINNSMHSNYPGAISIAEDVFHYIGFDSAWDTTLPYTITPILTNTVDANRDMTTLAYAIQYAVRYSAPADLTRVAFLETHDVVGDLNGGVRLPTAIDPARPNSYRARKLSTLGAIVTLTAPGIPMIFQGQEMLENQSFDSGLSVNWSKTNTYSYIVRQYRDLIAARRNLKGYTPGLQGDQCDILTTDNVNKLVAFHRWKSSDPNQDTVVVGNFSGVPLTNYSLTFPSAGSWYLHLSSDSTNYGADYSNIGLSVVTATGNPAAANLNIGPYSALVLSQTPDAPPVVAANSTNLSWPASYYGWTLQTASSLTSVWTQVPRSQFQTNGSTISFAPTASNHAVFYRLQAPSF